MGNTARVFILLALFFTLSADARPRRTHRAQRSAWKGVPMIMRGGMTAGMRQNAAADRDDLTRFDDLQQLQQFIDRKLLVPVSATASYRLDTRMGSMDPGNRDAYAHARPWVRAFLDQELGKAHRLYGERFLVTSLVRTRAYQKKLCRSNPAAICGEAYWQQSAHLTGGTVDIAYYKDENRAPLDPKAKNWLRNRLLTLAKQGKIIVIDEVGNGCFHINVQKAYLSPPRKSPRKTRHR